MLNAGIVILLIPPILVLAGILLLAYRKNLRAEAGSGLVTANTKTTEIVRGG